MNDEALLQGLSPFLSLSFSLTHSLTCYLLLPSQFLCIKKKKKQTQKHNNACACNVDLSLNPDHSTLCPILKAKE